MYSLLRKNAPVDYDKQIDLEYEGKIADESN
jgi:hypothetical protein